MSEKYFVYCSLLYISIPDLKSFFSSKVVMSLLKKIIFNNIVNKFLFLPHLSLRKLMTFLWWVRPCWRTKSFRTVSLIAWHKDYLFTVDAVNYQIYISTIFSSFLCEAFSWNSKHVYVLVKSTSCWLLPISSSTHPTESAMSVSVSGFKPPMYVCVCVFVCLPKTLFFETPK